MSNRYLVYFRNKRRSNLGIRTAEHINTKGLSEKEYRLHLLSSYVGRNRRVLEIVRI